MFLVPAFTGLGSPWWDPYARGTLVGITRGTTRAHLARAVVESMAFQTRDVVDAMVAASGHAGRRAAGRRRRLGHGPAAADSRPTSSASRSRRPPCPETTALGAAYLAGLAEGVWSDTDELEALWSAEVTVAPSPDRGDADRLHTSWLRAVERARHWAEPD